MPRRRPSFPAYVRRRWRVLGLLVVLLLASLLLLVVTDRGHDPLWQARTDPVDQVSISPDGTIVYALMKESGAITRLEARRGDEGTLLWQSPLNATRALLRAGDDLVAVATDFPLAFLTVYGPDASIRFQAPIEGNPQALAVDHGRVALAVASPGTGHPVLVYGEDGRLLATHRPGSLVGGLDLRDGHLGIGTASGNVTLLSPDGDVLLNASLPFGVRSLRLSADGRLLAAGGSSLVPGDLSGGAALFDSVSPRPLRWTTRTAFGVGLVDLDAAGRHAILLEETPLSSTLRLFSVPTGVQGWFRAFTGSVAHDAAGITVGAAISPDGRYVVASTLRGDIRALSAADGGEEWAYASAGTTSLTLARHGGAFAANAQLTHGNTYDHLLLFSLVKEPWSGNVVILAFLFLLVAAVAAVTYLAFGYWRLRQTW